MLKSSPSAGAYSSATQVVDPQSEFIHYGLIYLFDFRTAHSLTYT